MLIVVLLTKMHSTNIRPIREVQNLGTLRKTRSQKYLKNKKSYSSCQLITDQLKSSKHIWKQIWNFPSRSGFNNTSAHTCPNIFFVAYFSNVIGFLLMLYKIACYYATYGHILCSLYSYFTAMTRIIFLLSSHWLRQW